MTDQVSIVNQALGLLSANRIVDFGTGVDSDSKEQRLAYDFYDDLRDAVLEEADWSFAIVNLDIAADVAAPIDKNWSAKYQIPNETLRVISVNGKTSKSRAKSWVKEGDFIFTNYGTCAAKVLSQVTNPNFFSKMFVQALVYRIGWAWAIPITKSSKVRDQYKKDYIDLVTEATNVDGMQGTPESTGQGRLVGARYQDGSSSFLGPYV